MWADLFKRWMDLAFWWLPREKRRRPQARQGAPTAGGAEQEAAHERSKPERAEAAPATPEPAESVSVKPDDLTVIKGIGAAMQQRLRDFGIVTFRDLAAADANELTEKLQAVPVIVSTARVAAWIEAARSRL